MTGPSLTAKQRIADLMRDMMREGLSFDDAVDAMSEVFDQLISAEGLASSPIPDGNEGSPHIDGV